METIHPVGAVEESEKDHSGAAICKDGSRPYTAEILQPKTTDINSSCSDKDKLVNNSSSTSQDSLDSSISESQTTAEFVTTQSPATDTAEISITQCNASVITQCPATSTIQSPDTETTQCSAIETTQCPDNDTTQSPAIDTVTGRNWKAMNRDDPRRQPTTHCTQHYTKNYECLNECCDAQFPVWGACLSHMESGCYPSSTHGNHFRIASQRKANGVHDDKFDEKLSKRGTKPSEADLVELTREFYAKFTGESKKKNKFRTQNRRSKLMRLICGTYGEKSGDAFEYVRSRDGERCGEARVIRFEENFAKLGFGTLREFGKRHGFPIF